MSKHTPGPWSINQDTWAEGHVGIDAETHGALALVVWEMEDDKNHNDDLGGSAVCRANARLIAASPELLESQTMGAEMNTPDFLDWVADRMVHVYKENPNVDFVNSLRQRAAVGRAAIAKATGTTT